MRAGGLADARTLFPLVVERGGAQAIPDRVERGMRFAGPDVPIRAGKERAPVGVA